MSLIQHWEDIKAILKDIPKQLKLLWEWLKTTPFPTIFWVALFIILLATLYSAIEFKPFRQAVAQLIQTGSQRPANKTVIKLPVKVAHDHFQKPQYLVIDYTGPCKNFATHVGPNGQEQKISTTEYSSWKAEIHGDNQLWGTVGTVEDKHPGDGRIEGYRRNDIIVISYVSSKTSGHNGYGSFFLSLRRKGSHGSPSIWAGFAVFHDCYNVNGNVCSTPDTVAVAPAMMSSALQDITDTDSDNYYHGFKKAILASHLGRTRAEAEVEADGSSPKLRSSKCLETRFQQ